jgi:hypothetical protein
VGRGIVNCLEGSVLMFLELRVITRTKVVLGGPLLPARMRGAT